MNEITGDNQCDKCEKEVFILIPLVNFYDDPEGDEQFWCVPCIGELLLAPKPEVDHEGN